MTIPALNKCTKCGISRHIYLLVDAEEGSGKVCKDKRSCKAKTHTAKNAASNSAAQ